MDPTQPLERLCANQLPLIFGQMNESVNWIADLVWMGRRTCQRSTRFNQHRMMFLFRLGLGGKAHVDQDLGNRGHLFGT